MIKGRLKLDIVQDGKIIGGFDDHNLITMSGKQLIAFLLTGEPGNNIITKIGVGDNNSLPVLSDTGLSNAFMKPVTGHTLLEPTVIQWHFSIDTTEANGMNISEFGLFSEGEQLFSRKIRSVAIPKDDSITLIGYWTIWLLECKKLTFTVHPEIDFNINDVHVAYANREFVSGADISFDIASLLRHGVDSDDFTGTNGDLPDTDRWTATVSAGGTCEIDDNQLEMHSNTNPGLATLDYDAGFKDDFDANILYSHISSGNSIPIYWQISLTNQGNGNILRFNNGNNPADSYNTYIFIEQYDGSWNTTYLDTASYRRGKLNWVRNGSSLGLWVSEDTGEAEPTTLRDTMANFGTGDVDFKIHFPNPSNSSTNTWRFDDFSLTW